MREALLTFVLLLVACVCLATRLEPRAAELNGSRGQSGGVIETLMGESRKLFAAHFLLKADAYFHSGYYPGVFDSVTYSSNSAPFIARQSTALEDLSVPAEKQSLSKKPAQDHGHAHDHDHAHDHAHSHAHDHEHHHEHEEFTFLGEPRDWIERFSRKFFPSAHTHLDDEAHDHAGPDAAKAAKAGVREILPWLKLSLELDPNRIETYGIAAYYLRTEMRKLSEAEFLLREGLRANPGEPALLFELGRVHEDSKNDDLARNTWELALRGWDEKEKPKPEPDKLLLNHIAVCLAKLEERAERFDRAVHFWQMARQVSPNGEAVDQRIAEAQARLRPATPK